MAVDFTKQMKRDFTILAPDIFPTHMELLQEVFALHGYHVKVLHDEGPAVIAAGLKYLHNDMCYPPAQDRRDHQHGRGIHPSAKPVCDARRIITIGRAGGLH